MKTNLINFFMNGDLWTAAGGLSLLTLATLVAVAACSNRRLNRRWLAIGSVGVIVGLLGTMLTAPHPDEVLVRPGDAPLLVSPFEGAEITGSLAAGVRARATKTHGDFAFVTADSGVDGWVRKDAVARYVGGW